MGQELFELENLKNEDEMTITDYLKKNKDNLLYLGLNSQKSNSDNEIYCAILEPNPFQGHFVYGDSKIVGGSLKLKEGFEARGSVYKEALDELLEKIGKEKTKSKNAEHQMPIKSGLDDLIYSGLDLFVKAKEQGLSMEAKVFFPAYGNTVIFSAEFRNLYEMDQFYKENTIEQPLVSEIKNGLLLKKIIQESLGIQEYSSELLGPFNSNVLSFEFMASFHKKIKELKECGLTLEGINAIFTSRLLSKFYGKGL